MPDNALDADLLLKLLGRYVYEAEASAQNLATALRALEAKDAAEQPKPEVKK